MKLGLVTVLYNSPEVLQGFFCSLAGQRDQDWHLEVIDNSPNEIALEIAKTEAQKAGLKSVNFVYNNANLGVAKANNQGIENCLAHGCDIVILLNNDIEFDDPDLISAIRAQVEEHGQSLVAPRVHYFDSGKIWYGGGKINVFTANTKHFGKHAEPAGRYLQDFYTGYAPTCFMAIRSDVFKSVGLMDEEYFVYYDDTDFVYRCLRKGFKLRYVGDRFLKHKVSSSTGGDESAFSIFYGNRNRLFFIKKNLRWPLRGIATIWYFATRALKWARLDGNKRSALEKAVKEGLSHA